MTHPARGLAAVSLCPESGMRDATTDAEFWDYVFNRHDSLGAFDSDDDFDPPDPTPFGTLSPCPICGEYGACAYDEHGNPLTHVTLDLEGEQ